MIINFLVVMRLKGTLFSTDMSDDWHKSGLFVDRCLQIQQVKKVFVQECYKCGHAIEMQFHLVMEIRIIKTTCCKASFILSSTGKWRWAGWVWVFNQQFPYPLDVLNITEGMWDGVCRTTFLGKRERRWSLSGNQSSLAAWTVCTSGIQVGMGD